MNSTLQKDQPDAREKWQSYWRRRTTFFVVGGGVLIIAILLAVFLPPTYRAAATILIEQQEIPQEMVRSVITSFADQRVQVISQRVMTTKNLMELIERYNLYPKVRESSPREVLLQQMRDDISMHTISADVIDPRSGRPEQATIAFSVAYQNHSPDLALRVANDLTSLYLNENLTSRTQMSEQAAAFLSEQAKREAAHIAELDSKFAEFKQKHHQELPELLQLNVQLAQRTEMDLHESENQLQALDSQRVLLQAQLAQLRPNSQVFTDTGERVFGTEDRLKDLKSKLAAYRALYGPNHPDILSTEREVQGLEKEVNAQGGAADRLRQLSEAKAQLAVDQQKYSPSFPDVVRLQHKIESLEQSVQAESATDTNQAALKHADNPAYLEVKGQLDAVTSNRDAEIKRRDDLRGRLDDYNRRMAQSPDVERQYRELARDLESAQNQYQEILSKSTEAQVAQNLETERKGERFTLIEPPQPPEKPVSPNVLLMILGGLVVAVGLGFAAVIVRESLDGSVRGPNDIRSLLQVPALASIPVIDTVADRVRRKRLRLYSCAGSIATIVFAVIAVHFLVRPLDVLWLSFWRRLGV
jgi:polysaccharide biosynthesis transport protein